jgi:hypothetical protein
MTHPFSMGKILKLYMTNFKRLLDSLETSETGTKDVSQKFRENELFKYPSNLPHFPDSTFY